MTFGIIVVHILFLFLIFHFQKKDKIYIGYTTVLSLLFFAVITFSLIGSFLNSNSEKNSLLISLWILGSVLIYVMSQLTLAFEKIAKLTKTLAFLELEKQQGDQLNTIKPQTQKDLPEVGT